MFTSKIPFDTLLANEIPNLKTIDFADKKTKAQRSWVTLMALVGKCHNVDEETDILTSTTACCFFPSTRVLRSPLKSSVNICHFLLLQLKTFFSLENFFLLCNSEITSSPAFWLPDSVDAWPRWGDLVAPVWNFEPWRSNLEVQRPLDTLIEAELRANKGRTENQWLQRYLPNQTLQQPGLSYTFGFSAPFIPSFS